MRCVMAHPRGYKILCPADAVMPPVPRSAVLPFKSVFGCVPTSFVNCALIKASCVYLEPADVPQSPRCVVKARSCDSASEHIGNLPCPTGLWQRLVTRPCRVDHLSCPHCFQLLLKISSPRPKSWNDLIALKIGAFGRHLTFSPSPMFRSAEQTGSSLFQCFSVW